MKSFLRKKTIVAVFGVLAVILSGVYYLGFYNETLTGTNIFTATLKDTRTNNEYIIELHDDGFYPEELEINKGDTVKFTTTRSKPFWPASNLHPSHTIYSEFDSKEPINPKDSWSFRFEKSGEWKYHDHLAPIYKGKIVVLEGSGIDNSYQTNYNCEDAVEEKQCLGELVSATIKRDGIDGIEAGLDMMMRYGSDCHELGHLVGEEAYELYAQGFDIALTPKTYYCGYGFYHGFLETLLLATGDLGVAREFCAQANSAENACYHGIGHGVVDGGDPRNWGDTQAVIKSGLELCERVGLEDRTIDLCASGVFNSLAIAYINSSYGLSLNREDPYWICDKQSKHYFKKPCYEEMNTVVIRLGSGGFLGSARYVERIADDNYAKLAIKSLASYAVYFDSQKGGNNHTKSIQDCRNLQKRLHIRCIKGFVRGLVEFGPPESEYIEAINFCKTKILTEKERDRCYSAIGSYFMSLYSEHSDKKLEEVCMNIEEKYRAYCSGG